MIPRFESLCAAQGCLRQLETNTEHTDLLLKQMPFLEDTWVEFYEVLDS